MLHLCLVVVELHAYYILITATPMEMSRSAPRGKLIKEKFCSFLLRSIYLIIIKTSQLGHRSNWSWLRVPFRLFVVYLSPSNSFTIDKKRVEWSFGQTKKQGRLEIFCDLRRQRSMGLFL